VVSSYGYTNVLRSERAPTCVSGPVLGPRATRRLPARRRSGPCIDAVYWVWVGCGPQVDPFYLSSTRSIVPRETTARLAARSDAPQDSTPGPSGRACAGARICVCSVARHTGTSAAATLLVVRSIGVHTHTWHGKLPRFCIKWYVCAVHMLQRSCTSHMRHLHHSWRGILRRTTQCSVRSVYVTLCSPSFVDRRTHVVA